MVQTFVKRPPSPLYYEPLYTSPEDILYPGSDEEATPEERESKRLRVEIQGRQYLNGRPLFIQSAGLRRGPFEKGWVNPWKSKKRKFDVENIRRFPEAGKEAFSKQSHVEAGPSTAKRRLGTPFKYESPDRGSEEEAPLLIEPSGQEKPAAKRRRHGELDEPHAYHGSQREHDKKVVAKNINGHLWLKTDQIHPQALLNDDIRSSTPTPVAKSRSKAHAPSSPHAEVAGREITLPPDTNHHKLLSRSKDHEVDIGNINKFAKSALGEEAHTETLDLAAIGLHPGVRDAVNTVPSNSNEINLSRTDSNTRYSYDEVNRLPQGAGRRARRAKVEGQLQAEKPAEETAVRAVESNQRKTSSRLTPYVSEAVIGNDAASSAALRAVKASKPRPSPHAVPPSTYQPEFQYRYARKGMSTSESPQRAPFVDAPEEPQVRPRSDSSSSSGSSAFAEALEAAQEKAASKSFASSTSTSPAIEGPETKSVNKNKQTLRRLTFTPSGGAKIASARTSSTPCSSSSAIKPGKTEIKHQDKPLSNDPPPLLLRTSTKSSVLSLTNGDRSRNSIVLPEAQTDPIARPPLAQAPSGPSTNLLETDKQSPKAPSLNEDDSYLDLSTQAAAWKAQRSFQADVVLGITPSRPRKENSSPVNFASRKVQLTPRARGRRETEVANSQLIEISGSDEEEQMSTQAMVDAISPFAITTIKKPPRAIQQRTSIIPSPTKRREAKSPSHAPIPSPSPTAVAFYTHSPGMSTSPSPEKLSPPIPLSHSNKNSKPPSSLTSFSILPNGTLTETSLYQQDGQQQQDIPAYDTSLPIDPFGFSDAGADGQRQGNSWDLNAAIEEAGSFLGNWDVEAEARKEGSLSRRRESGGRGILKGSV